MKRRRRRNNTRHLQYLFVCRQFDENDTDNADQPKNKTQQIVSIFNRYINAYG